MFLAISWFSSHYSRKFYLQARFQPNSIFELQATLQLLQTRSFGNLLKRMPVWALQDIFACKEYAAKLLLCCLNSCPIDLAAWIIPGFRSWLSWLLIHQVLDIAEEAVTTLSWYPLPSCECWKLADLALQYTRKCSFDGLKLSLTVPLHLTPLKLWTLLALLALARYRFLWKDFLNKAYQNTAS